MHVHISICPAYGILAPPMENYLKNHVCKWDLSTKLFYKYADRLICSSDRPLTVVSASDSDCNTNTNTVTGQ